MIRSRGIWERSRNFEIPPKITCNGNDFTARHFYCSFSLLCAVFVSLTCYYLEFFLLVVVMCTSQAGRKDLEQFHFTNDFIKCKISSVQQHMTPCLCSSNPSAMLIYAQNGWERESKILGERCEREMREIQWLPIFHHNFSLSLPPLRCFQCQFGHN